jgi:hypothetical protein
MFVPNILLIYNPNDNYYAAGAVMEVISYCTANCLAFSAEEVQALFVNPTYTCLEQQCIQQTHVQTYRSSRP